MSEHQTTSDAESWSAFWSGAEAASEPVISGAKGAAFERFWADFFRGRFDSGRATMIDIACGAGPVSKQAAQMAEAAGFALSIHCTDYSAAAVRGARSAVEGADIAGFVADAAALPLGDEICDFAVSQFGLEYAGTAAFSEAGRVVQAGGALAAIVHLKGGAIEEECAANLHIVLKAQEIGLLPRARETFDAGFEVLAGRAPREKLQKADKAFAPVARAAKQLLETTPPGMARAFLERLYTDLGHMYQRMNAYAPEDIRAWIDRGEFELKAYEHRMASMIAAAQSESDMAGIVDRLKGGGLNAAPPKILNANAPLKPAAWALIAERPR